MSAVEDIDEAVIHRLSEPDDPLMAQWARFRDGFAAAMDGTLHTIEDLEQKVATHRAYFFPGANCAVVCEVHDYPAGARIMHGTWATGDLAEIVTLIPGIEAVARMQGCTKAIVEGPRGWERALKAQGYGFFSTTLVKDL